MFAYANENPPTGASRHTPTHDVVVAVVVVVVLDVFYLICELLNRREELRATAAELSSVRLVSNCRVGTQREGVSLNSHDFITLPIEYPDMCNQ